VTDSENFKKSGFWVDAGCEIVFLVIFGLLNHQQRYVRFWRNLNFVRGSKITRENIGLYDTNAKMVL